MIVRICFVSLVEMYFTDEISKFLLEEAKFDPNAKNNDGDNPLHLAFKSSNTAQVQHLVRGERCNLNEKDGSGNTPQLLHWAVRHKDDKLVKLLVGDERCNPHEKDSLGDTALHVACRLILPRKTHAYMYMLLHLAECCCRFISTRTATVALPTAASPGLVPRTTTPLPQ